MTQAVFSTFRFYRMAMFVAVWGSGLSVFAQIPPGLSGPESGTRISSATMQATLPTNLSASVLTAAEHPWGRFPPATWARTQTVTLIRNESRTTRNVSETKTTLRSVESDGVTLEESGVVDFGGRQITTAPVVKRYDFFQEVILDKMQITPGLPEKLVVDHLIVPCEKRIYEYTTPSGKHKATYWYSTQIYPYVFRIERIHRTNPPDPSAAVVLSRSTTEVLETSALHFRKNKRGTYRLQTIRKSGPVTTIMETCCSRYVPGGVFRETNRELDKDGREIRFSETRLINYPCQSNRGSIESDAVNPVPQNPVLIYEPPRLRWRHSP